MAPSSDLIRSRDTCLEALTWSFSKASNKLQRDSTGEVVMIKPTVLE